MNIARELLTALKAAGAKATFGIPGDYALAFFKEMEDSKILPLHTLSHEPGVGFAADATARMGGGVGVAVVTYGAGAMNMINSVACAWAEHSPLVVISGAPGTREMDRGLILHHQIKTPETQMNVFKEFTCDQARLDNPAKAPLEIQRVIQNCIKHSRPVYIEIPRNMVTEECTHIDYDFTVQDTVPANILEACLADVTARIKDAKAPTLLSGVQVRRFGLEETVFKLAEKWDVPLLNTFMAKGLFAGKKIPFYGTYLGLAGADHLRDLVEDSDLLFVMGAIPCDTNWGISGQRVDEKHTVLMTEESVFVCGKEYAGITMRSFIEALGKLEVSPQKRDIKVPQEETVQNLTETGDIQPDDIPPVLQKFLNNQDTVVPMISDVGDCLFMTMELENIPVLASGYYATMGFGVPAALGVQAATGQRPVVLVGDGGFQMTGWEMLNCRKYGWDPIVILLNNGTWEMLKQFQSGVEYTNIGRLDYAEIMEKMGAHTIKVEKKEAFAPALEEALKQKGKPCLIEVILPAGVCTSTMKRFATAIKTNVLKMAA